MMRLVTDFNIQQWQQEVVGIKSFLIVAIDNMLSHYEKAFLLVAGGFYVKKVRVFASAYFFNQNCSLHFAEIL